MLHTCRKKRKQPLIINMLQNHYKGYIFARITKRKHRKNHKHATFSCFWLDIECRNHKHSHYQNLPILSSFSREACLGRIKYLPLLALSYSGIPVKELYYLFLWQITSKLNLILIVADNQCIRQICIRILIVSANYQQINLCSKRHAITLPK